MREFCDTGKRGERNHIRKKVRDLDDPKGQTLLPFFFPSSYSFFYFFVSMYMNNLMLIWHGKRKWAIDRLHAWILHANVKKQQLRNRTRSRNINPHKKGWKMSFHLLIKTQSTSKKFLRKIGFVFCLSLTFPVVFFNYPHRAPAKSYRIKLDYYGRCIAGEIFKSDSLSR